MKSKVCFVSVNKSDNSGSICDKVKKLIEESKVFDFINQGQRVAVKIHFGEEGNTGFVNPEYVRVVCDKITAKGANAFLSDANTLYPGKRLNSKEHLKLAHRHGFTKQATGLEVIIPDDSKKENTIDIRINQKFIKTAKLARLFIDADAVVAISHFKGHMLSGFGGALKNLAMGCATREGKLAQHCDVSPVVQTDNCTGCGECQVVCPAAAIGIVNKKSVIDKSKCIGCASCIAACPTMAMFIDAGAGCALQEKMAEYAFAVLQEKQKRSGFINFALKINKECDCWGTDNPRIAPDLGIFASSDPVSIDKACFDLVNQACGRDIFKAAHPDQDGLIQLEYAQKLGLGSLDYDLIRL